MSLVACPGMAKHVSDGPDSKPSGHHDSCAFDRAFLPSVADAVPCLQETTIAAATQAIIVIVGAGPRLIEGSV